MQNLVKWLLERVNIDLGFSADHTLSLPEFCWWMVRNDLADLVPESVASKALRIKPAQFSDEGKRHYPVITGYANLSGEGKKDSGGEGRS